MKKNFLFLVILASTLSYLSCKSKSTGAEIVGKWVQCDYEFANCTIVGQGDGIFKLNLVYGDGDPKGTDYILEKKADGEFAEIGKSVSIRYNKSTDHFFFSEDGKTKEFCKSK